MLQFPHPYKVGIDSTYNPGLFWEVNEMINTNAEHNAERKDAGYLQKRKLNIRELNTLPGVTE